MRRVSTLKNNDEHKRREAGFDHDKEHTKNLRKMISHIIYKNYLSISQKIYENIY